MADPADLCGLVLCSKSPWKPPIRREHALASLAAGLGHPVMFIERPDDVRAIRQDGRKWTLGLRGSRAERIGPSLQSMRRITFIPGHRGEPWRAIDSWLLVRILRRVQAVPTDASVVCYHPWDWPAVAKGPARRRVFDMTDDWASLMPGREERLEPFYRQIAAEADEIVVVHPSLRERFPARAPVVVPNGVPEAILNRPLRPPAARTLVYVGTLTERFDAPLMRQVMRMLPEWRLDLVGSCLYAGLGARPDPELRSLLDLGPRVSWHGPMAREEMLGILDRATVAVIPNRPERSRGQDSMKLYDYAARGRPIVSTRGSDPTGLPSGAHALEAADADGFAAAILAASQESPERSKARQQWASEHRWSVRWPAWSRAVFGEADA